MLISQFLVDDIKKSKKSSIILFEKFTLIVAAPHING